MKSIEFQCLDFWRSKPADEEYRASLPTVCATGQFITNVLGAEPYAGSFWDASGVRHEIPPKIFHAAVCGLPHTFGAAAARLEKLLTP